MNNLIFSINKNKADGWNAKKMIKPKNSNRDFVNRDLSINDASTWNQ